MHVEKFFKKRQVKKYKIISPTPRADNLALRFKAMMTLKRSFAVPTKKSVIILLKEIGAKHKTKTATMKNISTVAILLL